MKLIDLFEARKNAHVNQKVPITQQIVDELNNTTDKVCGVLNLFVSLTQVDKLGINPKSDYETPLGIYCYPATYVKAHTYDRSYGLDELPFAGNAKFVNVFKVRGNIIDLKNMTSDQLNVHVDQMKKLCDQYGIPSNFITHFQKLAFNDEYTKQSPGGHFWYITMRMTSKSMALSSTKNKTTKWNKIFRDLNIDACYDDGAGIIHPNEPTQMVIFNTRCIYDNKRFDNVARTDVHNIDLLQRTTNVRFAMSILNQNIEEYIENVPFPLMSEILKKHPEVIQYIESPTSQHQKIVGDLDINNLLYIKPHKLDKFVLVTVLDYQSAPAKLIVDLLEKHGKMFNDSMVIDAVIRSNHKCAVLFASRIKNDPKLLDELKSTCVRKNDMNFFRANFPPV